MKNNNLIIGIVIVAILLVGGFITYNSSPVIAARGTSSIDVVPDEVSVNINIETRNDTAQLAQQGYNEIRSKLLSELKISGFSDNEIKFSGYQIYQDYDYSDYRNPISKGYIVTEQLVVKTNRTETVSKAIDAAIYSGALVSYINFEISDAKQNEIKNLALTKASENARIEAKSIAKGQGRSLGRVISVQNDEMPVFEPYRYFDASPMMSGAALDKAALEQNAMEATKAVASLSPTDQTIYASVTAQYKLSLF